MSQLAATRSRLSAHIVRSDGVATHRLVVSTTKALAPLVSEALFEAGAQGLEERAGAARSATLVAFAEKRAELARIWQRAERLLEPALGKAKRPQVSFEQDAEESWKTDWMAHLRPVRLTPSLLLAPIGQAVEPRTVKGAKLVVYEPALAFGDGDHPTTRMAARAIEQHYRRRPGGALLDIGTGTGVLAFVALLSGARRALGTDIDPESVRAATRNAKLNGLARAARFARAERRVAGSFDLVVVNIELRPLLAVLASLPAAARRAPRLLVTGILKTQLEPVASALAAAGFRARRLKSSGDWLLLEGYR